MRDLIYRHFPAVVFGLLAMVLTAVPVIGHQVFFILGLQAVMLFALWAAGHWTGRHPR